MQSIGRYIWMVCGSFSIIYIIIEIHAIQWKNIFSILKWNMHFPLSIPFSLYLTLYSIKINIPLSLQFDRVGHLFEWWMKKQKWKIDVKNIAKRYNALNGQTINSIIKYIKWEWINEFQANRMCIVQFFTSLFFIHMLLPHLSTDTIYILLSIWLKGIIGLIFLWLLHLAKNKRIFSL